MLQRIGHLDADPVIFALALQTNDLADAIDMAEYQMPAQFVGGSQGALKIDPGADNPFAARRLVEGFTRDIDRETRGTLLPSANRDSLVGTTELIPRICLPA